MSNNYRKGRQIRAGRFRFDQAVVTDCWLWLLLTARGKGWKGGINGPRGGLRSYAQQAALYAMFRAGIGNPAFPPSGPSRHLIRNMKARGHWSMAVDVSEPQQLIRIASKLGVALHTPYPNEPWHVEAKRPFTVPK